jgi:hypothetical protein
MLFNYIQFLAKINVIDQSIINIKIFPHMVVTAIDNKVFIDIIAKIHSSTLYNTNLTSYKYIIRVIGVIFILVSVLYN